MDAIKRKRILLKSASIIKQYLAQKGYSVHKLSNKNAIVLFARDYYKEDIENFNSMLICEEWLISKIEKDGKIELTIPKKKKRKNHVKVATKNKVPSNGKVKYLKFLRTSYWKNIRQIVILRDNHTCTKCGSLLNLRVHHTTYKHHLKEHEHLEDLITVCNNCHKIIHGIINRIKSKQNESNI